jgi:2-polyprenyl-6-methoxyphenol hydroxylase-like FAD-dependent oxidoreductase
MNPQVLNPQVLIAGAGPVGLTAAAELARYGISVRIIDKAAQRSDKSKALVLWSRTLELLDRAGASAAFVAAGNQVDAARFFAGNKQIGRIGFAGVDSPYPYALMIVQSETERLLEAHLESLGVKVERAVELTGFKETGAGVAADLRHADGSHETVTADWMIGCDGAHSTVRHGLGLSFLGKTLESDFLLADVHITGLQGPLSVLTIFAHEDGILATFPISEGRYRIIADLGASKGEHPADPTLAQIQAIVDRRSARPLALSDPIWLAAFRVNERKVGSYRAGRIFVAGDAAHVHSPAGGQGMNTGMQDAFNLSWKLALVCRGTCTEELLDSYSAERSAVGEQVLKAAGRMTALAILKNHTGQMLRNFLGGFLLGLAPVRSAMANNFTEVAIGYPHSPLNGPSASGSLQKPAPGERLPPRLQNGAAASNTASSSASSLALISALSSAPRFQLFAAPGADAERLMQAYSDLIDPVLRAPLADGGMWLVRPDGYVAAVVRNGDWMAFSHYLDKLQRPASH